MSDTPGRHPNRLDKVGPLFASIWLFFLLDPLARGLAAPRRGRGVVGIVATVAFAATYMTLWVQVRADRMRLVDNPSARFAAGYLGAALVVGRRDGRRLGEQGMTSAVYVAVGCVMVLPLRAAAPIVVALIVVSLALSAVEDWGSQIGLAFAIMAASSRSSGCAP